MLPVPLFVGLFISKEQSIQCTVHIWSHTSVFLLQFWIESKVLSIAQNALHNMAPPFSLIPHQPSQCGPQALPFRMPIVPERSS